MEAVTSLISTNVSYSFLNETENPYTDIQNSSYFSPHNITNSTDQSSGRSSVAKYYPVIVVEMVASCLCLIFSIAVYSILPEFRNVHGKNLISMSYCLLITYLMLILDLAIRNYVSFSVCFTIAMIIHVTFLGTFFWTNVMAFDIWRTLTAMKTKGQVPSQSRKYLKYSIYAWVATVLTALPAAVLEATNLVPESHRPNFGVNRCWLSGKTPFIYYFNLPVGIILFCNLIMFILTIIKLRIIKKMTAVLNVKQQQERLGLYLKLFLVMGITWTTEFVPWMTGVYGLYALAGMLTALHGCILFFIFVCKKRILRTFLQRIRHGNKSSISTPSNSTLPSQTSDNSRKLAMNNMGDSKF